MCRGCGATSLVPVSYIIWLIGAEGCGADNRRQKKQAWPDETRFGEDR